MKPYTHFTAHFYEINFRFNPKIDRIFSSHLNRNLFRRFGHTLTQTSRTTEQLFVYPVDMLSFIHLVLCCLSEVEHVCETELFERLFERVPSNYLIVSKVKSPPTIFTGGLSDFNRWSLRPPSYLGPSRAALSSPMQGPT